MKQPGWGAREEPRKERARKIPATQVQRGAQTHPVSLPCYSHRESGVNFGLGTDTERQSTSKGWGPCAKRKPERRVVCGCGDIFV